MLSRVIMVVVGDDGVPLWSYERAEAVAGHLGPDPDQESRVLDALGKISSFSEEGVTEITAQAKIDLPDLRGGS